MAEIAQFPYFEVQFTKEGAIFDANEAKQVLDFLAQGTTTDLFVFSHGWCNDMNDARNLYRNFFGHVRDELNNNPPPNLGARTFAVLGILWPSKKFTDDELIAGGAASLGEPDEEAEMISQLESLKGVFDHPNADQILEQAKTLVPQLENNDQAAREFATLIRSLPSKNEGHPEDGSDNFFKIPAETLMDTLSRPELPALSSGGEMGGAAGFEGGAAGLGSILGGFVSAARQVLNFTTYYQMKERAGIVGRGGVNQLLRQIRERLPNLKIHLIGHSFGGRLVAAAADGPENLPPVKPNSMTLLQAAFSHNGFAEKFDQKRDGFFRKVVTGQKVAGPIIITHSILDKAVGMAYPIASKLSGDDASGFGDASSPYGGIGRNGAQFTPEADNGSPLGPVSCVYQFQAGKLYNLKADTVIMGHSDIARSEVAHALLSAISTT